MDLRVILDRIDQRNQALGLRDNAISKKAGCSRDLIRNWRRKAANGDTNAASGTRPSVRRVAQALGVSAEWLAGESDDPGPADASAPAHAVIPALAPESSQISPEGDLQILLKGRRLIVHADVDAAGLERLISGLEALAPFLRGRE